MREIRLTGLDPRAPLRPNAATVLGVRLAELKATGEAALEPSAAEAQHNTRIAAKRVRYLLEVFGECFGPQAEAAHGVARELQGVLGDLHDCDVLLPLTEGIGSLEALIRKRRASLFQRFCEVWSAASSNGTWTALDARLQGY